MNHRAALAWAGILGASAVALGAFGAHALRPTLDSAGTREVWDTAARYHLVHAVALLAYAGWLRSCGRPPGGAAAWTGRLWVLGRSRALFQGQLYGLAPPAWRPQVARPRHAPRGPRAHRRLDSGRMVGTRGLGPSPMAGAPPHPDDLRSMLDALRRVARPRLVGGAVRDWLLGLEPKNFDVEVAGIDFEGLRRAPSPPSGLPGRVVGRSLGACPSR